MTRFISALALILLLAAPVSADSTAEVLSICFTPGPQCAAELAFYVRRAVKVRGQYYGFSDPVVAAAFAAAAKNDADVVVILDRSNLRQGYSSATFLAHAGVKVLIDAKHPIAHNKVTILDDHIVITGSMNLTAASHANAENIVMLDSVALAKAYLDNWEKHAAHSTPAPQGESK